ncbi:hypothetical protein ALQ37_102520 [Pseudomonas syringae pv. aptata]|uniref:Uncharacterized protein n=2 Tax=Pseudomonas syringae group TaxID=136849 RepID=A0A3M4Y4K1_9PSED|nr:hypothetical protein ALO45_102004 [Pseudomonas syringae pv. syringae]KPZ01956.1 hypothetical protein ALO85_101787 [Pseudomonas syringae pv. aptata]RMO49074.1 hypothetical protein ALQ40_04101 [Pseudomonas syringae]RMR82933.1 hypothetical protein ALP78_01275 [Pseudomonas coronafaciens pv. striafaciens]RML65815.1 hypothetical protein ALQ91_101967 [Pseudomonas syringae pv. syringae]
MSMLPLGLLAQGIEAMGFTRLNLSVFAARVRNIL